MGIKALGEFVHLAAGNPEVTISSCTSKDIEEVLELDLDDITLTSTFWTLPLNVDRYQPGKWYEGSKRRLNLWHLNSEATTRTAIDLLLLDVLHKSRLPIRLSCWGEISLSVENEKKKLNGRADYFLGYGARGERSLHTLLIAGEAKALNAPLNIWQIVAYAGIVHRERRKLKKTNSTTYGFITDSAIWKFIRVDNNSKVWISNPIVNTDEVGTWLRYIIDCAWKSTPSTTPATSHQKLSENDGWKNFSVEVERFTTTEDEYRGIDHVEDDSD
jgi:hypothetical protein